jgi:hypothetical protein
LADKVLYVYAITGAPATPHTEAVDGSANFGAVAAGAVTAVYTPVDREEFSQEAIDRRAGDLEWLGAIGYRHQAVVGDLMKHTSIVPLRAFTFFSTEESLKEYLKTNGATLSKILTRLDGKQEWTVRIEFDPERWNQALTSRVKSLRDIVQQIETSGQGKAFLLKKKLDDERKRASREAEQQVVAEIEQALLEKIRCEAVSESREQREGAFPQINLLINRDEEAQLTEAHQQLMDRYTREGVTLGITGPWPPYTFANV